MVFIIVLQLMLDIFILGILILWMKERAYSGATASSDAVPNLEQLWDRLEMREKDWENEVVEHRQKLQSQWHAVMKISSEAEKLWKRVSQEDPFFSPSVEELELRALKPVSDSIPTVKQWENTQRRVKEEIRCDLKQLLKEQVA